MNEQIKYLQQQKAEFVPATAAPQFELLGASLTSLGSCPIPENLAGFYRTYQMAILGDAIIFPPAALKRSNYEVPGIVQINQKFSAFKQCHGRVVWGRNSLYIFTADLAGALYIHDVLTLQALKKYDDLGAAITDCLMVGKA